MAPVDRTRKDEVLATAAELFASSGYRVSVQDIAAACGIVPAGLYHHFESKDAIVVELTARYRDDLEQLADQVGHDAARSKASPVEQVVAVGRAIADCAVRHRAAVLLTYYDPPAGSSDDLAGLARAANDTIKRMMRLAVDAAATTRALRRGIDADDLADRIGQSMVHVAIGAFHRTRAGRMVPERKCRILLEGVVTRCPPDSRLDVSPASRVASAEIAAWDVVAPAEPTDKLRRIVDAARHEFGRRGYEVTTVRRIAAAAGVSTAAVYREAPSKEALLSTIMHDYFHLVAASWRAVLRSPSTPAEKLDALLWLDVNVLDRFPAERRIEIAWLRQSPPATPSIGPAFAAHLRGMRTLVAAGVEAGEFVASGSLDVTARSLYALAWTPEALVQRLGTNDALRFARSTVLRGAFDTSHAVR